MTSADFPCRFNQVAISVSDRERSLAFYRDLFGLTEVGGTSFSGRTTEKVQGMAGASSRCSWLVDDRPHFQLEIFTFTTPRGRPYASARQPHDVGYTRLIFSVPALAAIAAKVGVPMVQLNGHRSLVFRDADGIWVQAIEARVPRARLTGVALTVPDLAVARRSFVEGCGCRELTGAVPDWGSLWGERGADKDMIRLDGETLTLEISRYRTPASAPWPKDYVLADLGILNVAIGFASGRQIRQRLRAMERVGFEPNTPLVAVPGLVTITYANDPQGFSVEMLYVTRVAAGALGFRKANVLDRALMAVAKAATG